MRISIYTHKRSHTLSLSQTADFSSNSSGGGGIFLKDRSAAATNLKGVAIDANIARLEWFRGGSKGTLSTMYKLEYQIIRHPSFQVSSSSSSSSTEIASEDGGGAEWTQAQMVAATATIVGYSAGKWHVKSHSDLNALVATRGCCEVYNSAPRGRSAQGATRGCAPYNRLTSDDYYECEIVLNQTEGGGLQYGDKLYPVDAGDTIYFLYSPAQSILGTPLQPLTNQSIVVEVALPQPDTEYLMRVRSANLNQGGFETLGSNLATILSAGRPEIVTTLEILYMSGDNAVKLSWLESKGGSYCGDVVYRLLRQPFVDYFGAYSGRWAATHSGYMTSAPGSGGVLTNLSWWNTNYTALYGNATLGAAVATAQAAATSSKALFVVCSFCQTHLVEWSPAAHTLPFLQDTSLGLTSAEADASIDSWCALGNILEVQNRARPKDAVTDVRLVGMGLNSLRLTWHPVTHADRYKVLVSHRIPSNISHTCRASSNASWSSWHPYTFPLSDYPGKGAGEGEAAIDAIFSSSEAFLFAPAAGWTVSPTCGRRFKILGGSAHGGGQGSFPSVSEATDEYWIQPAVPYLASSLISKTRLAAYVGWSYYPRGGAADTDDGYHGFSVNKGAGGGLRDPANHSEISFIFYQQKEGGSYIEVTPPTQLSNCLDVSQILNNSRPISSCAEAPTHESKERSQQANFTSLEDSEKYKFRIRSYNLQLLNPPRVVGLFFAATCSTPSSLAVCLSPFEASSEQGRYQGLAFLVVSGKGVGFYSRNISQYFVSGAGITGERSLELSEPVPAGTQPPDESSVVALISLGEVRFGVIAEARVAWSGFVFGSHIDVSRKGAGAAPLGSLIGKFLRIQSGKGRGIVNRIVSVNEVNNTLHVLPAIPPQYQPVAGDLYEVIEYHSSVTDLTAPGGGGIQLHGAPMEPLRLSAVQTFSGSALFDWVQPTKCDTKAGVEAECDAAEAYLEAKMTHNSGDFVVLGAWGDFKLVVGVEPFPAAGKGLFTGLAPLASFQVRVRVRSRYVVDFGKNSNSFLMKLTDNPPASLATIGLLTDLGSSDSMVLTWTIPGTLDFDTPPYVTQFMVRIGEDEAPVAGGLLAQSGRVETIIYADSQQTVLRDYLNVETGTMQVFERVDVCKYRVDRIRHPYALPALALNPAAIECRATVYGLAPARIYVFRYTHTPYIYIYINTHTYVYVYAHIYVYYIRIHICTYIHIYIYIYTYMYIRIYAHT